MVTPQTPRRPVFFWQAVFILLPVVGLGWFGLYSLRQDRVLAEQEARESGAALVRRMAEAVGRDGARRLWNYQKTSAYLRSTWLMDLGATPKAGTNQGEDEVVEREMREELANGGILLAEQPPASGNLGAPVESVPEPPEWLMELNPKQQDLWEALKQKAWAGGNVTTIQPLLAAFRATKPLDGAEANADYLELLAQARGLPPKEAAKVLADAAGKRFNVLTEAGLPLEQLICYQSLRLTPTGAGVSKPLLEAIARSVIGQPLFFTPQLAGELQRVVQGTEDATNAMKLQYWMETTRLGDRIVEDFLEQYPTNTWASKPFWVNSGGRKYLLLIYGGSDDPANFHPPPGNCPYLLFSQAVMVRLMNMAVAQTGNTVPPYAQVELEIGGVKTALSHNDTGGATNATLSLLGEADGTWERLPLTTNIYPFRITARLANPGMLYARQRQRTWLFTELIVISTGTAVLGLVAAWRSFRRQRELSELKSNFVSSVSHELRAPIASVRLMAENLEHGKVPDVARQHEYFRFIVQECRRLSSLIENVLDFSRIEQGRKQYEFEPTDVGALTQMTVKLMEPYAAEKGVRLELAANGEPGKLELNVDGRAIQQALVNLIDNAIKHSAKGQAVIIKNEKLKIKNETGPDAQEVVQLSVIDQGPGIAAEEHEKIFERFYRLGSELRRETQGVGIGLSVVKHIVEAHGGRVTVVSEPGKGSRFTIELPVTKTTCNES